MTLLNSWLCLVLYCRMPWNGYFSIGTFGSSLLPSHSSRLIPSLVVMLYGEWWIIPQKDVHSLRSLSTIRNHTHLVLVTGNVGSGTHNITSSLQHHLQLSPTTTIPTLHDFLWHLSHITMQSEPPLPTATDMTQHHNSDGAGASMKTCYGNEGTMRAWMGGHAHILVEAHKMIHKIPFCGPQEIA